MTLKLQPMMVVMNERLECGCCGALAVFMALDMPTKEDKYKDFEYAAYCQDCWKKAGEQDEEMKHDH